MGLQLQKIAPFILRGQGGGSDGSHDAGQQLTPHPFTGPDRRTALGPALARRSMDARGTLARLVNGSSALRGRLDALLTVDGPLVRVP